MRVGLKSVFAALLIGITLGYLIHNNISLGGAIAESEPAESELFICPRDNCADRLVEFIDSAEESVHVMIYSFTHDEIAGAVVSARGRGLDVRVVMDGGQAAGQHSKDEFLVENGVGVRLVDPAGYAIMHHKVAIIDGEAFSTGSFNYSKNADTGSAENLLVVYDKGLALEMESEFAGLWDS